MNPAASGELGDRPIRVGPAHRHRTGASKEGDLLTNRWGTGSTPPSRRCPPNVWPRQTLTPRAPCPAGSTTHHHSTPLTPASGALHFPQWL